MSTATEPDPSARTVLGVAGRSWVGRIPIVGFLSRQLRPTAPTGLAELLAAQHEQLRQESARRDDAMRTLLSEVQQVVVDRQDRNLQELWKSCEHDRAMLTDIVSQIQRTLADVRDHVAGSVENLESQVAQLHDHHASCYLRLATAAEDTAAGLHDLFGNTTSRSK